MKAFNLILDIIAFLIMGGFLVLLVCMAIDNPHFGLLVVAAMLLVFAYSRLAIVLVLLLLPTVGCQPEVSIYHDWRTGEHWCEVKEPNGHIHRYSWRQGETCLSRHIRW